MLGDDGALDSVLADVRRLQHTSHVTRHTSHITRHTSHATRHTSHVKQHPEPENVLIVCADEVKSRATRHAQLLSVSRAVAELRALARRVQLHAR
jgi:hypothetical protein